MNNEEGDAKNQLDLLDKNNGHIWGLWREWQSIAICKKCGYMKRLDGNYKKCPGIVQVILRGNHEQHER